MGLDSSGKRTCTSNQPSWVQDPDQFNFLCSSTSDSLWKLQKKLWHAICIKRYRKHSESILLYLPPLQPSFLIALSLQQLIEHRQCCSLRMSATTQQLNIWVHLDWTMRLIQLPSSNPPSSPISWQGWGLTNVHTGSCSHVRNARTEVTGRKSSRIRSGDSSPRNSWWWWSGGKRRGTTAI